MTTINQYDHQSIINGYNLYVGDNEKTVENLKEYLTLNGFSTAHAEELFEYFTTKSNDPELNNYKIRKMHPKRDAAIKKVGIPAIASGALAGSVLSALYASTLVAGSTFFGLPVLSQRIANMTIFGVAGFAGGVVASTALIGLKNALTKQYYKMVYGNAKSNLKDYSTSISLENTKLAQLIQKIEETKAQIMELRTGSNNPFSKAYRGIKRTLLNAVNRNRLHHVEACTKSLIESYYKTEANKNLTKQDKINQLQKICDMLQFVDNFVARDVKNSKIFALLNCDNSKKGHNHKEMIENLDIYANLANYINSISTYNATTKQEVKARKEEEKQAKRAVKNLTQKQATADEILNGDKSLFQKTYDRLANLKKKAPQNLTPSIFVDTKNNLINITIGNTTYVATNIQNISNVNNAFLNSDNTLTIVYNDNSTIVVSTTQKQNSSSISTLDRDIIAEAKILEYAQTYRQNLTAIGYSSAMVDELISTLDKLQSKTKKKRFKDTKRYKEGNFSALYNEILNWHNNSVSLNTTTQSTVTP